MNATEISPSRSIESSLLGYNNAPTSPSAFPLSPTQSQNPDTQDASTSSQTLAAATSNTDIMDHQPTPPPDQLEEPPPPLPPIATEEHPPAIEGQDHDRMVVDSNESTPPTTQAPTESATHIPSELQSLPVPPPLNAGGLRDLLNAPTPPPQVLVAVQSNRDLHAPPEVSSSAAENNVDVSARERSATESSTDHTQEAEEDTDDDDYDGQMEFLNHFREDVSSPNEEELKEIESRGEKSAMDNEEWKKAVFTPLDDPEYIIGESGVISWTLQGFHGTKQSPNKKRIMRSPVVTIGGYKWNLKVFPHGNEGTDYVSVYIECSGEDSPAEDTEMETAPADDANAADQTPRTSKTRDDSQSVKKTEPSKPWDVAAQIGCVMYNPQESRIWVFEKATHHFEQASQDWGWVRFHGPWTGIHQRRHLQRKPILQNDTLAFTAFIRTVKDPTKALWWRSVDQLSWDSIVKTGYRGLSAEEPASYAIVAALAPWLHLKQARDLIFGVKLPDPVREPLRRIRPLFTKLRDALYQKHSPTGSSNAISLSRVQAAFDWYEHSFVNSSDVIELWESFRNTMNEEYYNQHGAGPQPDILGFIKTIRYDRDPVLPGNPNSLPVAPEPQTVQQVLDNADSQGSSGYKDWEGWSQASSDFPSVLQVELPRQRYDTQNRKWKKLTHKIKLDDEVVWKGTQFTLFSIIIHKGELGSGRFYSIVRPGGPESRWIRYKSSVTTYLTHRQAVEAHEGKGDARDGTESVAYIAIYIRSSQISELAPVSKSQSSSGVLDPLPREATISESVSKAENLPVIVHSSSAFPNRQGIGFVDPWSHEERGKYELSLPIAATLYDVQQELVSKFNVAGKPEQCRLWPMKTALPSIQNLPQFEQFETPDSKLLEFAERIGGIHLWLHIIQAELIVDPILNNPAPPVIAPQDSAGEVLQPPSTESVPPEPQPGSQDVVMGGTQEHVTSQVPEEPGSSDNPPEGAPTGMSVDNVPVPPAPESQRGKQWQLQDHVYILIKRFDPQSQSLTGIGSFFVIPNERIRTVLPQLASLPDSFKVYHEMDAILEEATDLSPDATFSSGDIANGSVFVFQPDNLSETTTEEIRQRGEATVVPDYYQIHTFSTHFAYQGSTHKSSYFGGPFTSGPLRNGRCFGQCTMIDDATGDAYVGNCVGGHKSGQGIMYYANGNTYTGEWANDLPEGKGKMVYHPTGNTYIGGWQKGRRHGKGVMKYEVADEQLRLCKICYETEMDALFYRCGHIAACEMCARQVRDCPVCRRQVDAVVKIWRT